jgi:hypothetical protein
MRIALAALAATLFLPSAAAAKPPYPGFCTIDPVVFGSPAGDRTYRVLIRDINNAPIAGHVVTLDFSQSALRLYTTQEAGTTLNCANRTLSRFTLGNGMATFHPRFGGACNAADVQVFGEGVLVAQVPARSTDVDGTNACADLQDFVRFAGPYLEGSAAHPELDFDGSGGNVGLGDFVLLARDILSGEKGEYCP